MELSKNYSEVGVLGGKMRDALEEKLTWKVAASRAIHMSAVAGTASIE